MKKWFAMMLAICLVAGPLQVYAHIMNKDNAYDDLQYSEAADAIIVLSALHIVQAVEGSSFYPQRTLSTKQLAAWYAAFRGSEGQTVEELANASLQAGYVSSLEGEATYTLINTLYFNDTLVLTDLQTTLTHEQFALFMLAHLTSEMISERLVEGPTGIVEAVEQIEHEENGHVHYEQQLTIGGTVYSLDAHPYVIADSVDPTVWIGKRVTQSFIAANAEAPTIQLLVVEKQPILASSPSQVTTSIEQALSTIEEVPTTPASPKSMLLWVVLVAIGLIGVVVMFVKARKRM